MYQNFAKIGCNILYLNTLNSYILDLTIILTPHYTFCNPTGRYFVYEFAYGLRIAFTINTCGECAYLCGWQWVTEGIISTRSVLPFVSINLMTVDSPLVWQ